MIHNIASCDAVIAPRTEINTRSTKNFNMACVHCCVVCCMYGETHRIISKGLISEIAKFKNKKKYCQGSNLSSFW